MAGEVRTNISCKPKVDATNTEAVWKQRIDEGGWFVDIDPATTTADVIGVDFLAQNAAVAMGRLIGYTGTGDDFVVTVEPRRSYGYAVGGNVPTAFTPATHFGKYMKADDSGKLNVDTALTAGNIVLVGGTPTDPAVAWSWPE